MAQIGVPFGEIAAVRDWMKIHAAIDKPAQEHPKRPIPRLCLSTFGSQRAPFLETVRGPVWFAGKIFTGHFVANYLSARLPRGHWGEPHTQ